MTWSAAAGPALAQVLGRGPEPDFAWARWVGALLLCLLLAVGGALALRARIAAGRPLAGSSFLSAWLRSPAAGGRRVRVIETVRASPTLELCLFTCDGEDFIVAATSQGIVQLRPSVAARGNFE